MQKIFVNAMRISLLMIAVNVAAEPEMRCRLDGAYIRVYGKTEAEQRETCERQGGELTRYAPQEQHEPNQGQQGANAVKSIMGR